MNTRDKTNRTQTNAKVPSTMEKIEAISRQASQIGTGPLFERVAVPNPNGGYYVEVRKVAGS